jgi:hypothetical protein
VRRHLQGEAVLECQLINNCRTRQMKRKIDIANGEWSIDGYSQSFNPVRLRILFFFACSRTSTAPFARIDS